ncbi:MAG: PAS domain S-box protein [Xanthobacteraceae bacterium]|nr:PAS domain S-box protein [Xanthobacteraceae bacterium]
MLRSPVPIVLLWGADGVMIYNDAYSEFAGGRHPRLLGSKVREGWPEVADFNDNVMRVGLGGGTLAYKNQELTLYRHGRPEQVWMNLDYSPVLDEAGHPAGVIAIVVETTQRVMAERTLKDRENDLARVQEIAKVGGVTVDLRNGFDNGRRSPEYKKIHGLDPDVADTHDDWIKRLHPEDRDAALRHFVATVNSAETRYSSEYRIVRPSDGQVRWIVCEAQIERDEDGQPLRLVGAHMDITERALAREQLGESEARFRLIANSAPVPMWVSKLDGTRGFANQAYLDFLGLDYEQALVFDWRKVIHPDDLPRIISESLAGEASLKPFALEGRYRRADGAWRWMRSESQPRWDPSGAHVGFIGVAHDVTAAKVAEAELRRLNETLEQRIRERTSQLESNEVQLRAILETTNQYQGLLDLEGNILYVNKTALAGIQAVAADVVGRPFWDSPWFAATKGAREVVAGTFAAARRGEGPRAEMLLHLPIGDRLFEFVMRPVLDQQGAIVRILTEAVDITERRQAEEALRQSQKMEAVGQLTGGVAHDFNNMLTIIRSATDFLRRRGLSDERQRRYIDAISDTVDRASTLTGQLLAFARRQPLTPEVFDVGRQVDAIVKLIRPLVGGRIQIGFEIRDPDCFALADIAQFETTLINLAVNSRDAMHGEGVISIRVEKADQVPPSATSERRNGQFIAVSVKDVGTGIAPEKLTAIFEPFYTTKEVGKGTGLGLSQALGFAKQSGGDVVVVSELGKGSTFTVYLPQAEAPDRHADTIVANPDAAPGGRGRRILVVEDNENIGKFSVELLQDLGYESRRADNARQALALIAADPWAFDLVFSDVIMPGMNGVELAGVVRKKYPHLPVLLTSGYSIVLAENAHHGFELIQKPYSVEALSRALRRAISEWPPADRKIQA